MSLEVDQQRRRWRRRVRRHYQAFVDYGDATGYRRGLLALRDALGEGGGDGPRH